ncbi:MAG: DUF2089 domain-containing protein, partial [Anaerolineae bacterium]
CHDNLLVTHLICRNCGTGLEGRFAMGRLFQLTPEQLYFVEVFLRCEGKINRVQDDLGISYPTVRSRLEDIVRAMGYEVKKDRKVESDHRQDVLGRLARKEISSEEAFHILEDA